MLEHERFARLKAFVRVYRQLIEWWPVSVKVKMAWRISEHVAPE